jgi:hypothetical protein
MISNPLIKNKVEIDANYRSDEDIDPNNYCLNYKNKRIWGRSGSKKKIH